MHPAFEKDYRFLLSSLIPRQHLSRTRIEGIDGALSARDRGRIVHEAYLAMEELVSRGVFLRDEPVKTRDGVSVSYRQRTGKARFTLEIRDDEWGDVSGSGLADKGGGIVPAVISGLISSLTVNYSSIPISEKIEDMLALLDHIERGSSACLLLFKESYMQGIREGDAIKEVSSKSVKSSAFYAGALRKGKIHAVIDAQRVSAEGSLLEVPAGTRSIVLVPLFASGENFGILQVHVRKTSSPDNSELFNIYLVAQGIVRLIENNRHLEEMVSVDRLTKVNNRSYYETQLPLEMERATRNRKSLGFIIMDIDDFKKFNDTYGHDVGDDVLRLVAQTVRSHLRRIDLFFRYGGEEFVALLPGTGREAAERTAERIREVVSKTALKLSDGRELAITVTIGGCIFPLDASEEKELFRKADQMLLEAKTEGKNMVKFFGKGEN